MIARQVKIAIKRLDVRRGNRWAAIVNDRHVGRAARPETALRIARQKASEHEEI